MTVLLKSRSLSTFLSLWISWKESVLSETFFFMNLDCLWYQTYFLVIFSSFTMFKSNIVNHDYCQLYRQHLPHLPRYMSTVFQFWHQKPNVTWFLDRTFSPFSKVLKATFTFLTPLWWHFARMWCYFLINSCSINPFQCHTHVSLCDNVCSHVKPTR